MAVDGRWMIVTYDGRPVAVEVVTAAVTTTIGTGEAGTVPVVPCDHAAIERAARALWDLHRRELPGRGEGMEPPWGDRASGQTATFYQQAEAVLRAAAETP